MHIVHDEIATQGDVCRYRDKLGILITAEQSIIYWRAMGRFGSVAMWARHLLSNLAR